MPKRLLSAVPEADPEIARRKKPIELPAADIPSLLNLPPGCTFHPRYPHFVPGQCDTTGNGDGGRQSGLSYPYF